MVPFQFRIDIFDEMERLIGYYKPLILSTNIQELELLATRSPFATRNAALSALELTQKCERINVTKECGETNDDVIIRIADKLKCPVATNDATLRKSLRDRNIATIFLRNKSHLEIEGYIRSSLR